MQLDALTRFLEPKPAIITFLELKTARSPDDLVPCVLMEKAVRESDCFCVGDVHMELQAASSLSTYLAAMMVLLIGYPFGLVGVKLANSGCRVAKQKWVNRFNYFFALILLIFMIAHIHSDTFLAIELLQLFKPE
jgi:hypothetical protein